MKNIFIYLFTLIFSPLVLAGSLSTGVGNGGHVLICPERVEKVILLDSYEARKMGLTLDLDDSKVDKQTWRTMVGVAVNRLKQKDQYTAALLEEYALEMVTDFENLLEYPDRRGKVTYLGYDVNVFIKDSLHVSIPEGCESELKQLVNQRTPQFRFEYRYQFNKKYWDKMSLFEQSMTILHEAWYRIMIENGATDSKAARYINGLIASKEFESFSFNEYFEELKGTELKEYIIFTKSDLFKNQEIRFNLKELNLNLVGQEVCAPDIKLNMWIKETYSIIRLNTSQKYLENLQFKNVCFKDSQVSRLVMYPKTANSDITFRLPFYQLIVESATDEVPTIFFHKSGSISHFSGFKFSTFLEMFYKCNGSRSYVHRFNCEKGPFNNHDTKIENPKDIKFDESEKPIGYFVR